MGAPSEGNDALFRNPLPEVQRFFELRHEGACARPAAAGADE